MGNNELLNLSTNVRLELFNEDGVVKQTEELHNTTTTLGKQGIADQILASPTLPKVGWCELGTGSGGTTLLNAYIAGSRTAFTSKTRGANAIITTVTDFAAGTGTGAITEAGLFNIATQNTGDMWHYASFPVINKGASDSLKITWTITIS